LRLSETFEYEFRRGARNRKTLRHRRTFRQHARKFRLGPDRREINAAVMKAIGVHQAGDQAKRQLVAIERVRGEQRPAGLQLDGPETVELDGGLSLPCKWRIRKLG